MPRWLFPFIGVLLAAYVVTVLVSGTPEYLIPAAILAVLIIGYALLQRTLTRRELARHGGDVEAALRDDEDWAIPSAHLIGDDETQAGDTPEVHDEINPHDLPIDHPGRAEAERQAASHAAETTGNASGAAGGRFERTEDRTPERAGARAGSAGYAKTAGGAGDDGGHPIVEGEKTDVPGQRP
jgi:hypothetical protein